MADDKDLNEASRKSKAEGERWESDSETVERRDRQGGGASEAAGGITNRPLEEEQENQASLPDRGKSREGAHAGHGDRDQGHSETDEADIERSRR